MPFPVIAGDRLYTRGLSAALAAKGVDVVFAGLDGDERPLQTQGLTWHVVSGGERRSVLAGLSPLPFVAARHATASYRREITRLVNSEQWDFIVVDHYGMGWAVDLIPKGRAVVVFVAHNYEAGVTESQWRDPTRSVLGRAYYWQNWMKTRWIERHAVRNSDLLIANTDSDAGKFKQAVPGAQVLVLTPAFDGAKLAARQITAATPRSVIMVGSYRWSAKRASLLTLLDQCASVLDSAGIKLDVVGDMDEVFKQELAVRFPSVQIHGRVSDPAQFMQTARLALIAEPIGGGFKNKLLEYIFNRVPVAILEGDTNGLPEEVKAKMIVERDIPTLLARVVAEIDDFDKLNDLQRGAFDFADGLFEWEDRARRLLASNQLAKTKLPSRPGERRSPQQSSGREHDINSDRFVAK